MVTYRLLPWPLLFPAISFLALLYAFVFFSVLNVQIGVWHNLFLHNGNDYRGCRPSDLSLAPLKKTTTTVTTTGKRQV